LKFQGSQIIWYYTLSARCCEKRDWKILLFVASKYVRI